MTINVVTMLGVGLILSQAVWAMSLLRIIGALYLLYLALGAFKKIAYTPPIESLFTQHQTLLRYFLAGD